jgi:hypothetical protein
MKPNEERWTRQEILRRLLAPRPKPVPKPAAQRAQEAWAQKPTKIVIQDAARAETALLERLERLAEERREERREAQRKEEFMTFYQGQIDIAWQRTLDRQAELAELQARCCHRGPGDSDW